MSSTREPYLSVVVTARNDDHGGNLLGRMQAFVNGWIGQARRYQIPSELIVVEWNPPPGRPRLRDALHWPEDLGRAKSDSSKFRRNCTAGMRTPKRWRCTR